MGKRVGNMARDGVDNVPPPSLIQSKSYFPESRRKMDDDEVSVISRGSVLLGSPEKSEMQNRSISQPPPKQAHVAPLLGQINLPPSGPAHSGAGSSAGGVSIYQNKKMYLDQKRKEEIERLEADVARMKEKAKMNELDYATQLTTYKEK